MHETGEPAEPAEQEQHWYRIRYARRGALQPVEGYPDWPYLKATRAEVQAVFERLKAPMQQLVDEDHADIWRNLHDGWQGDPKAQVLELVGEQGEVLASFYIRVERPFGYHNRA